MKTLIFNGSSRSNGNTAAIIEKISKDLNEDIKIITAYSANISPCVDCRYCWENNGCCVDDDTQEILLRVKEINNELEELETQIAKEKTKSMGLNEHDIRFFLTQFRDYDILNVLHRKAIVNMLINRIYVYDDYDGDKKNPNIMQCTVKDSYRK